MKNAFEHFLETPINPVVVNALKALNDETSTYWKAEKTTSPQSVVQRALDTALYLVKNKHPATCQDIIAAIEAFSSSENHEQSIDRIESIIDDFYISHPGKHTLNLTERAQKTENQITR